MEALIHRGIIIACVLGFGRWDNSHLEEVASGGHMVLNVLAILRSKGDVWSVGFFVLAYFALILLFWLFQLYEWAAPNAAIRGKLKAPIWSLSTFLTSMFSYKVATLMPWPVALVVWGMVAFVIIGGFYGFFILHDR